MAVNGGRVHDTFESGMRERSLKEGLDCKLSIRQLARYLRRPLCAHCNALRRHPTFDGLNHVQKPIMQYDGNVPARFTRPIQKDLQGYSPRTLNGFEVTDTSLPSLFTALHER